MSAVPAALFLGFRKRFGFDPPQMRLWVVFSLASLLAVIAFILSPSSTAIDRLALYLIPVQIVILSRLPGLLGERDRPSLSLVTAVVAYSLVVELVWLNFGQFSWAWLPYQNYLWTPAKDLEGSHRR